MAEETSRVKNSLYNIVTGIGYQGLVMAVSFISRTVFIYCLGKTYLGVSGLFTSVLSILGFAELGIGRAIVFSLYKPIADGDEEQMLSLMKLFEKVYRILFFVVLGLGFILMPFLPYFINDFHSIKDLNTIYLMYVVSSASSYLFVYKSTFLTACQKNYMVTIASAIFYIATTIVQIAALLIFKNFLLYLAIQIASGILQNIYVAYKTDKIYPFLKRKDAKPLQKDIRTKIRKDVGALILYNIGMMSLYSTDNLLISKFVGVIAVGLYSNYSIITGSVTGILGSVFANITASIGHFNASESNERKYFMFRVINFAVFWLYSYAAICLYVLIGPFIGNIWLGDTYTLDNNVVFIICLNIYIVAMLYTPSQYRQTLGLFVQGKYRPIVSGIVNLGVSIVLGKYYGLAGVLWGTAITRLSVNVWYDPFIVFRKLQLNPMRYYCDYFVKMALMLTLGGFCTWACSLWQVDNLWKWIVVAIALTLFINLVYISLYRRTEEYKYLKEVVLRIVGGVKSRIGCRFA